MGTKIESNSISLVAVGKLKSKVVLRKKIVEIYIIFLA